MKALILAGGFGTRLRPLTLTRPKHLLPIVNVPHIEHVFDLLRRHGVGEIVLLTSYLADAFAATVARAAQRGIEVEVAHEEEPLGTAGALKNAQNFVGDDTFFAFNGDVLTDVDLSAVLEWHRAKGAEATLVLTPVDDPSAYGVVPTDTDGRVTGFIEKPSRGGAPTNLINAGVYVLEPRLLDRIPAGEVVSAERELFPAVVEDHTMYGLGTDAYWMDIGTPEKLLQANMDLLSHALSPEEVPNVRADGVLAAAGAEVHPSARVSSCCLGRDVRIEGGAVVHRAVLLPGASVGVGASVRNSTLGEGARIGPGVAVEGVAIGDGQTIDEEQ
ncbi:MAG: sugar phosphate nucleotidyltransferase [Actinomycetota bacterium]